MVNDYSKYKLLFAVFISCLIFQISSVWAQNATQSLPQMGEISEKGMTLWQLLMAGGFLMFVLAALSLITMALIIYNFIFLKKEELAPTKFAEDIIHLLERGDEEAIKRMCTTQNKNIFSSVIMVGLDRKEKGKTSPKEAMENAARKEIGSLWQNINYLADIATISPLVGLLGTVFGMIQAFNSVAFQSGMAKPILLAGGVAKAMVTTAGGLLVAIPALSFYSYFKVKVQEITTSIETHTQEMTQHFADRKTTSTPRRKADAKD